MPITVSKHLHSLTPGAAVAARNTAVLSLVSQKKVFSPSPVPRLMDARGSKVARLQIPHAAAIVRDPMLKTWMAWPEGMIKAMKRAQYG